MEGQFYLKNLFSLYFFTYTPFVQPLTHFLLESLKSLLFHKVLLEWKVQSWENWKIVKLRIMLCLQAKLRT